MRATDRLSWSELIRGCTCIARVTTRTLPRLSNDWIVIIDGLLPQSRATQQQQLRAWKNKSFSNVSGGTWVCESPPIIRSSPGSVYCSRRAADRLQQPFRISDERPIWSLERLIYTLMSYVCPTCMFHGLMQMSFMDLCAQGLSIHKSKSKTQTGAIALHVWMDRWCSYPRILVAWPVSSLKRQDH